MVLIASILALTTLFNYFFREMKPEKLPGAGLIILWFLFIGFLAYLKKRQVVYIDKNDFVIKGKKILITDVISIEKVFFRADYRVRYYDGDEIKSFLLEIDQVMNTPPDFMKKLIALARKNNHKTPNLL